MSRRRKGGIKRGQIDLGCILFPKCSPQPGTHTEIHRGGWRREGEGGDRADLGEKRETTKGREQTASNHTAK